MHVPSVSVISGKMIGGGDLGPLFLLESYID